MRFWPTAIHVGLRIGLLIPLAPVIVLLMIPPFTPLGLLIAGAAGTWMTKPLRKHPVFNVEGDAE